MTSEALRRLADQKIADSRSLAHAADLLRAQASALFGLLDPLVGMSQRVWAGPAAEDFERQSAAQARRVDGAAGEIQRIATDMERRARLLQNRAAQLRAEANRNEAATAAAGVV